MRLIDADEMKDELKDMDFVLTKHNLEDWIDEQPTVDAEPVRHGKWVNKNWNWYCSECDKPGYKGHIPAEPDLDYCPNCGAKMDLEGNNG